MPAGSTVLTKTADAIKAAVQMVSGVQVVYQGKRREVAGDLEDVVRALQPQNQGIFWFSMDQRIYYTQSVTAECSFRGNLMVRLDKDDDSDCNDAYDLAEDIGAQLAREGVFQPVGSRPKQVTWNPADQEQFQLEDDILVFEYQMSYTLPMVCG